MEMKKIHAEVLELMERVRGKHKEFYYGTRQQNRSGSVDRINAGYIFQGDENYVFAPICPKSAMPNPTRTIGLVVRTEDGRLISSWLEVLTITVGMRNESACDEDNAVYEQLIDYFRRLGRLMDEDSTKAYTRNKIWIVKDGQPCEDILKASENFLLKYLKDILKILGASKQQGLLYTSAQMHKSINSFLKQYSKNDTLSARLRQIATDIAVP